MGLDDLVESEVAVAVAATAAVMSPRVRRLARSGAVYGLAGALIAGDAVYSAARGVGRGAQQAASSAGGAVRGAAGTAGGAAQSAAERVRGTAGDTQPAESGS